MFSGPLDIFVEPPCHDQTYRGEVVGRAETPGGEVALFVGWGGQRESVF